MNRLDQLAAAVEKRWPWLLGFSCLFVFLLSLLLDSTRPLWNDELFTYYISRQPSMGEVWKTLLTGAEQLPPFFYVIIRAFTSVFGPDKVVFRLPETLGFLGMCLGAFFFVQRRSSPAFGLVAFTFPALTYAYFFAYEARPYGLVMGFCGGAILCWQTAAGKGTKRTVPLLGLALCLASALACHYYAVLVFFPFALAEAARFVRFRRLDLPMYSAIALGALPLLLCLPLLRASSQYSSKFWAKPQWTMMISFYENVFDNSAFALLLLALCAGFFVVRATSGPRARVLDHQMDTPIYELVLPIGFALLPLLAVTLAKLVTGAYTLRYAIPAVLGVSILLAFSLSRMAARSAVVGLTSAAIIFGCWTVVAARQYKNLKSDASDEESTYRFLEGISRSHPVVIAGPHVFFTLSHRAELQHAGRFIFLTDVPNAIRYTGTDTVERGLLVLRHLAPLDVQDYRAYSNSHPDFLVYDPNAPFSWVLGDLIKAGRPVSIFAEGPQGRIYAVGPPHVKP